MTRPHTDSAVRRAKEALGSHLGALERSLDVYYGNPVRDAAMDALYSRFVKPGGLAFDIGSHVGDRIASFRRLGARVVALEPQPLCATAIRAIHGGDGDVTLVQSACGAEEGILVLHVNSANPTVTTASTDFVKAADGADGWQGQVWDETIDVAVTTLDALIASHGRISSRSMSRVSRIPFWLAFQDRCLRCPSSSPRSSVTWQIAACCGWLIWVTAATISRSAKASS
jgi:FkbM family methyltransferase